MGGFCSSCGKKLPETSVRFCEYCGSRIESHDPNPSVSDLPASASTPPPTPAPDQKTVQTPLESLPKRGINLKLVVAGLIVTGLIIVVAMVSPILQSALMQGSSGSDNDLQNGQSDPAKRPDVLNAQRFLSLPPLPKDIILLGQIHGPIPGKQVEFVYEGGPNAALFKSWAAVLIGPDGSLLGSKEGKMVRNDLITLQGQMSGTHTGLIIATSYSGETYKIVERAILFRG